MYNTEPRQNTQEDLKQNLTRAGNLILCAKSRVIQLNLEKSIKIEDIINDIVLKINEAKELLK